MSHSLVRVCPDVKIPNVVHKQQGLSIKGVFAWLFCQMDQNQLIELDASQIAQDIGLSRRQVYRAINFLKSVNLLILKMQRTGRGCHSLFYLNWRKSVPSTPIKKNKNKNHIHDQTSLVQKPQKEQTPWTRMMGAFRRLMSHSWFQRSDREYSLRLIGKCVRGNSLEWAKELFHRLAAIIHTLDTPDWVLEVRQFYAWFRSVINRMMQPSRRLTATEA